MYYKEISPFKNQSYLIDVFNKLSDGSFDIEISKLIKLYSIHDIRNKSKILKNFILFDIDDNWIGRLESSKKENVNSLDRFISLYGEIVGKLLYDKSKTKLKNKVKEIYFKSTEHFLSQKPFIPFKNNLVQNSLNQISNIILKFDKKYLINLKKEMVVNLLKYNVDGDWEYRLNESDKYRRDGFSLNSCKIRYGDLVGEKIYKERIESVMPRKENYTEDEWIGICNSKKSNLGLDGYVKKFGEEEGEKRWNEYFKKWRIGIDKRKETGWKSGASLEECQEKYGVEEGYRRWRSRIDKRKMSLSLDGYIKKFGDIEGNERWKLYCLSNNKTSYNSFIKKYGETVGSEKYILMIEKIRKYLKNSPTYSKISQELFNSILEKTHNKEDVKYAIHGGEEYFFLNEDFCRSMFVDFKCGNAIIEFYGDFWHANPKKYLDDHIMRYPINHKIASDVWELDNKKIKWLMDIGYNVMVVWESDYLSDKQKIVDECIKFIEKNYEKTN